MQACSFTDPRELADRIKAYFEHCEQSRDVRELKNGDIKIRQEYPSVIGLAVWLGCSKDTIYSYINKESKNSQLTPEMLNTLSDVLARARDRIEQSTLSASTVGDYDQRIAAMVLTNFGYGRPADESPNITIKVESTKASDVDDWSR